MIEPQTLIDGRYRVLSKIGSGGMAEVYLAQDELLGREVALKVLHEHFAEDSEFVERFRREASAAAGLSHPNIVGIFDRGEWKGTYYIAMEYVAGRPLKEIVRELGPLPPTNAIDIVVQILRAARFAHKRGVIHRDLKPHNVILDEEGRARVTDFGIARAGASDMTLTGSIMGTAQYLSPEQAQGHAVTAASDLYSVGVILYELLTGVVPFEGETAVAIAFKQVAAEPRPPSALNASVPPSLDAIVMRALAKDPARRYADADEFITVLERERSELPAMAGVAGGAPVPPLADRPYGGALLMAPAAPHGLEDPDEQQRRPPWWLWGLLALLIAGAIAAALLLLLPGTRHVTVPNVRGQTEQAAGAQLRRAGLVPAPSLGASAAIPTGHVVSQSPAGGQVASKGSRVSIVVSEGPASAALPNVEGLTVHEATERLTAAGFKPQSKQQSSATVAAGRVLGTEPPAGLEALLGSRVTVLVSSGPEAVKVPDVVGQSQSAAEATLSNAGLETGSVTHRVSSAQSPGTVLSQSPTNGSSLHAGGKVNLVVAQASEEVAVPNVVGQGEAQAAAALGEAGLKPKATSSTTSEAAQVGIVLRQSPAAGTRVHKGSKVTIAVGVLGGSTTPTTPTTPTTTTPTTPAASPAP